MPVGQADQWPQGNVSGLEVVPLGGGAEAGEPVLCRHTV